MIAFDMDGVLTDFTLGFTTIGHKLFGTPVLNASSQLNWIYEDYEPSRLDKEKVSAIWAYIKASTNFWENLYPLSLSTLERINALPDRCFVTNRIGIDAAGQTERWLQRYGIRNPKVFVTAFKRPVYEEQKVQALIDDYYPNCKDALGIVPAHRICLLHLPHNVSDHRRWILQNGKVVLSVEHFLDEVVAAVTAPTFVDCVAYGNNSVGGAYASGDALRKTEPVYGGLDDTRRNNDYHKFFDPLG